MFLILFLPDCVAYMGTANCVLLFSFFYFQQFQSAVKRCGIITRFLFLRVALT